MALAAGLASCSKPTASAPPAAKPVLTVSTVQPTLQTWERRLSASGNVQPWQEASIGTELGGARLAEVRVNVGDRVRKGEVLAVLNDESARIDLAQYEAAAAEAEANLMQARSSAERALALDQAGAISRQDMIQYDTLARTNAAKLAAARAQVAAQQLKLRNTRILAIDDGVVSSRTATVGAVLANGSELFKLIRQGRLEWRAELRAEQLAEVRIGQAVSLRSPGGELAAGRVRQIAPTVDLSARSALVYVDLLGAAPSLKAGVLATGDLLLGRSPALTLAQSAVIVRDGNAYAMKLTADQTVRQAKLSLGRRQGDRVEVLAGLQPADAVVAQGAGFLNDGDRVSVVGTTKAQQP